jgi:sulfur dioxygenase
VLNTHVHADHVTGSGTIKKLLGPQVQSVISSSSGAQADRFVKENDRIEIGEHFKLRVFNTPGNVPL